MHSDSARIRPYQPTDLDDMYRVCLQTANDGQDGASLFRFPSHMHIDVPGVDRPRPGPPSDPLSSWS